MSAALRDVRYVFIDNGGVITDNSVLSRNYLARLGELLSPHFGGSSEQWAEANKATFPGVRARHVARLEAFDPASGDIEHEKFLASVDWLRSMCAFMGVGGPASDEECAALSVSVNDTIITGSQAAFAGAQSALKALSERFTLFTASEGSLRELTTALGALGVAGLFQRLYGPDYVNTPKQAPSYYQRIFEHAGVDPGESLVVDDWPVAIERAGAAGARTVLVAGADGAGRSAADTIVRSLAELPALLTGPGSV